MPSTNDSPLARATGKGVYPHQFARSLLNPLRGLILSHGRLVKRLALEAGMTVLEPGPGPGYFSIAVARAIVPGTLHMLDIQPEMLAIAARRLQKAGVTNFVTHAGDAKSLPIPDASIDVIFLVTVLGEIVERDAFLEEAFRVLQPGGLLSVSEMRGDPDRLPERDVATMTAAAGFRPERTFHGFLHYTFNTRKPA